MSQTLLDKIQYTILIGEYELTDHAYDEMEEDDLTVFDIENALLSGQMTRIERNDQRGAIYTIKGLAEDRKTEVGVVGRFSNTDIYIIITVYEVTELEG